MTREAFSPSPSYPISGTGPYQITHPYKEGTLVVAAVLDGSRVELLESEYSISPVDSLSTGEITLTTQAATDYDTGTLYIRRATDVEQGWLGQSAREKGLEAQLDWLVEGLQDLTANVSRTVRTEAALSPITPKEGYVLVWDGAGNLVPGPSTTDISEALPNAEAAAASEIKAKTFADAAKDSAEKAALYDVPTIDEFPELATVTAAMVDVSGLLRCIKLGVVYERAADAATDADLDYSGSGGLKWYVVGGVGPVPVEAFGAHQLPISGTYSDSYAAIQKAWDWSASERGQAVLMQGDYAITQRLTKAANAQIVSDRRAVIRPLPGGFGAVDGILIGSGNHLGKTVFPQLAQFTGIAFEVQGDIGHFYVPQAHTCGTAFKINAGATDTTILDVELHFDAIANCTWPFEIASANPTDVIQGLHIKGNFITATTNCLKRTGVGSFDDGMVFDILAIDFTAGGGVFMDNQIASHVVPRATVKVTSWIGGAGFTASTPTKLFQGRWDTAEIDLCNASYFSDDHQSTDLVRASKWKLRRDRAVGSPINLVELAVGLAGFNGGKMISETNLLVKYTLPVDIGAGQSRSAYLYHCLADGNYQRFSAQRHQGGNGIIVEAVHDQSSTSTGRIALTFRNVSSVTVIAGTEVFVAVRRH